MSSSSFPPPSGPRPGRPLVGGVAVARAVAVARSVTSRAVLALGLLLFLVIGPLPRPTAAAVEPCVLQAEAVTTVAHPGDVVLLYGALHDAHGAPIGQAPINAWFGHVVGEFFDLTDEQGKFSSMAQVPLDATPGSLDLTVGFGGDHNHQAAQVTISIQVNPAPTPTPSPTATAPDQEPEPTPEPEQQPSSTPLLQQQPEAPHSAATVAATLPPATAEPGLLASPTGLLLIGGVGAISVAGVVGASAAVRHGRRAAPGHEGLAFLGDAPDEDDPAPAPGAGELAPDEGSGEPPRRARRGFDPGD